VRSAIRFTGVAVLIFAIAWLSLSFGRGSGPIPAIWWADAALVAIMLLDATPRLAPSGHLAPSGSADSRLQPLAGRRHWPLLLAAGFIGNLLAHLLARDPLAQSLLLSACDTGEAALAASTFAYGVRDRIDLADQHKLLRFVGCAVLLAPFLTGIAAAIVLPRLVGNPIALVWRWFPPHALAMAIVPPLGFLLARRETSELIRRRVLSTLLWLGAMAGLPVLVFARSQPALLVLLIPLLLFFALRLGSSAAALGCCMAAAGVAAFAISHRGALNPVSQHRVLLLQLLLAAAVLSVSIIAVVLAGLERAGRQALENEQRYLSMAASMEMIASLDPLTQLANRRRFDEVLDNEWYRALRGRSPLSLILIDTDHFQAFNEQHGQQAGDECLKRIARTLNESARRPADLVARCGGGEFGIILPDTDAEGALGLAETLRGKIEELGLGHAAGAAGLVTVSAGCATMTPLVGEAPNDLLSSADEALYEAKRQGRNRIEVAVFRRPASLDL
jgi:diguanylate cyclase (GGDEF)-like protein